jgi:hypothetical protein
MNAQDFRSLQEAYNQVHQVDEDAGIVSGLVGLALGAKGALHAARKTKRLRDYPKNFVKGIADPRTYVPKKKKEEQKEQVDIYDLILSHLLDEGYADTEQAAEAIMVNMSEEWREDIVEAAVDYEMSSDEMEKARNERKFGKQGFNQAGQTALRRGLHKSQRGMKKKDVRRWEGDK